MFLLLPYGNDRRTSRFPFITYSLMLANVVIYLMMLQLDQNFVSQHFGLIPFSPTVDTIFTSMFVHTSYLHLAWNMLFLWLFGPNVEDVLGRVVYPVLYLAAGFAAALMHMMIVRSFIPGAENIPVIGASGAVAGILGVFAVRFYRTGIRVFWYIGFLIYPLRWGTFTISAIVGLWVWFVHQFAGGVLSVVNPLLPTSSHWYVRAFLPDGVAYWSHIGGMLFGVLFATALSMGLAGTREYMMQDARASIEEGSTWHAIEHLCSLLKREPENAAVHGELARTYALQGDEEDSLRHYRKCIELRLNKGECRKAMERFAELKHFYRDARLDLKSEFQLARHLIDTQHHGPALSLLTGIISTYPDTPEAEMSLMKAGDLYLNALFDPEKAIECYEQFLEQYPQSSFTALVTKSLSEAQKKMDAGSG